MLFGGAIWTIFISGHQRPPRGSQGRDQLGYVSHQLGHADVSVTARHYARWAGEDAYRGPLEVGDDEVPADLLARLAKNSPHSATV